MKPGLRHSARLILLSAYLSVGMLGQLQSLGLLNSLWQLFTAAPQHPPVSLAAFLPQPKHVPGAERISVPDAAIAADPTIPRLQPLDARTALPAIPQLFTGLIPGDSPRAPPVL